MNGEEGDMDAAAVGGGDMDVVVKAEAVAGMLVLWVWW